MITIEVPIPVTLLDDQAGPVKGTRRWLVQAKTTRDPAAPVQAARVGAGGGDE